MVKKIIVMSLPLMLATSVFACQQNQVNAKPSCEEICKKLTMAPGGYPPPMDHFRGQPYGPMMAPGGYPPPRDHFRGQPYGPMMAPGGYPPPPPMNHFRGQPYGPMMAPGGYPPPPPMNHFRGQPHGPMMTPGGYPPPPPKDTNENGAAQKNQTSPADNEDAGSTKDKSWW